MKTFIATLAVILMGFAAFAQSKNTNKTETIVLVHGAWLDASCWDAVTPQLQAKGYEVIVVNLPGHGKDTTSFAAISLQSYIDAVKAAIGDRHNILLVGHSMGGIVISGVAEQIPGRIKELIYLGAFLPRNGESLLALAQQDAGSHIGKSLQIDKNAGSVAIAADGIIDIFAADAPKAVADHLLATAQPDPLAPMATPEALTGGNFGSVKKVYIYTLNDHAISYAAQQRMAETTTIKKEYKLASSHTPFFSMPDKVTAIILQESR